MGGEGGGGFARRRDCFLSLSPNINQRTGLFCSSPSLLLCGIFLHPPAQSAMCSLTSPRGQNPLL